MVEIEVKGKRKYVGVALLRFRKLFKSKSYAVQEFIPEFYFHASDSMSVSIKLCVSDYRADKAELDNLKLEGSSIKLIDNGYSSVLTFIKPARTTEFVVKKQDTASTKVIFSAKNLMSPKLDLHPSDTDSLDLKEGETLEQYEQRLYGAVL